LYCPACPGSDAPYRACIAATAAACAAAAAHGLAAAAPGCGGGGAAAASGICMPGVWAAGGPAEWRPAAAAAAAEPARAAGPGVATAGVTLGSGGGWKGPTKRSPAGKRAPEPPRVTDGEQGKAAPSSNPTPRALLPPCTPAAATKASRCCRQPRVAPADDSPVMKGCCAAWRGVQRVLGFTSSTPAGAGGGGGERVRKKRNNAR
jgi:hypothetical protein